METIPLDIFNKRARVKSKKMIRFKQDLPIKGKHEEVISTKDGKAYNDFIEFWFLMFVAILDSAMGLFIFCYSIWSYIRKHYFYGKLFKMGIDMSYFTIIGSMVAMCCPWITIYIHKQRLEYIFALISMELVEIIVLITGLSIGNVYLPNYTNTSLSVRVTFASESLNQSFYNLLQSFDVDNSSREALDRLQGNLQCCGITKKEDYIKNELIMPDSCCPQRDCAKFGGYYEGCRVLVQRDIAWHTITLKSLSTLLIVFYTASFLVAVGVYLSEACKLKRFKMNIKKDVNLL